MITTFQNLGRLEIPIASVPINQADRKATYMIATGVIPDDKTIVGDLYDAEDNLIARKRVYAYDGPRKNSPFALSVGQIKHLSGKDPDIEWYVETIKSWMKDRQTKDEDDKVKKDKYYYTTETKEELLAKIKKKQQKEEGV